VESVKGQFSPMGESPLSAGVFNLNRNSAENYGDTYSVAA
jgi:hypothetical protein